MKTEVRLIHSPSCQHTGPIRRVIQGACVFDTGCRGACLLVWLILNDRVQPSFIAGVVWEERHVPPCKHSYCVYTACLTGRGAQQGKGVVPGIYIVPGRPCIYTGRPCTNGASHREGRQQGKGVVPGEGWHSAPGWHHTAAKVMDCTHPKTPYSACIYVKIA